MEVMFKGRQLGLNGISKSAQVPDMKACSCATLSLPQQICLWKLLVKLNQFNTRKKTQEQKAFVALHSFFFIIEIICADEGLLLWDHVAHARAFSLHVYRFQLKVLQKKKKLKLMEVNNKERPEKYICVKLNLCHYFDPFFPGKIYKGKTMTGNRAFARTFG